MDEVLPFESSAYGVYREQTSPLSGRACPSVWHSVAAAVSSHIRWLDRRSLRMGALHYTEQTHTHRFFMLYILCMGRVWVDIS